MTHHTWAGINLKQGQSACQSLAVTASAPLKSILLSTLAAVMMVGASSAKELPEAPSSSVAANGGFAVESTSRTPAAAPAPKAVETKNIDIKFVSLALISTGSTFADSYTTLFARQNWLAGKQGVCNIEVESAYLYGTHPTVGRAYAVASAKSVGSIVAAYYLRKHHSRFWSVPLVANSIIGLQGVTQNMRACN